MEPYDTTWIQPAQGPTVVPNARSTSRWRRAAMAGMAAGLLTIGGIAVVSAASPDPSASPSAGASETVPGSTDEGSDPGTRAGHDCPNDSGSTDDGAASGASS